MNQYMAVLEDWDDMVGEDWQPPNSIFLNPQLQENPYDYCYDKIQLLLQQVFQQAQNYMATYEPILQKYYENDQYDPQVFRLDNLEEPVESLQ